MQNHDSTPNRWFKRVKHTYLKWSDAVASSLLIRRIVRTIFGGVCVLLGIFLGAGITIFVTYPSAFRGPTTNPGDPGFQSGGTPMLSKTNGNFNRDTMSMQALREKMDTLPSSAGDATAANQTAIKSKTDLIGTSADVANESGTSLFSMIKYISTVVDGILANVLSIQAQTSLIGSNADVANQSGSSLFSLAKYIATAPGVVSAGGGGGSAPGVPNNFYYTEGGNPNYCKDILVSPSGKLSSWAINTGRPCDTGKYCATDGTCTASSPGATVTQIAVGAAHICILLSDNTIKCWGYNGYGQLGTGNTANSTTPVAVSGITNAVEIAAGGYHTCARLSDNTVKCWGVGTNGQLGDNSGVNRLTPVTVAGITNATGIAAGSMHTCARLSDNTIKCWGANYYGQLGNSGNTDSLGPVAVTGMTNAVEISSSGSGNHTCARLSNNTVQCWGANYYGQLGNGTTANSNIPVAVSGITTAGGIAAGSAHTCARLSDNTMKCWGDNSYGELGNGTSTNSSVPVAVSGISTAVGIAAGYATCAQLSDNTMKCWGANSYGQLGNGTFTNSLTPVTVLGISNAAGIATTIGYNTCVRLTDSTVKCWGANDYGQLGDGTTTARSAPIVVY
ncbi:MAG: hypothetical protein HQK59_11350 [Deltaproteobacteria bacterium]|nr:hypothetical protein [Deltaproteobacteria bacterium]